MLSLSRQESRVIAEVVQNLQKRGFKIEPESTVAAGYRPDIIVELGDGRTFAIECKIYGFENKNLTYDVIGQATKFCLENERKHRGGRMVPLVVGHFRVPKMVADVADASGVRVIPVRTSHPNEIAEAIATAIKA